MSTRAVLSALAAASLRCQDAAAVTVLDFGADPSGTKDSTSAFRKALQNAGAEPVGVPAGAYQITGTLTVAGQTLQGLSEAAWGSDTRGTDGSPDKKLTIALPTINFYPFGGQSAAQGPAFELGGGVVRGLNVVYQWGGKNVTKAPPCIQLMGGSATRVSDMRIQDVWDAISSVGAPQAGQYHLKNVFIMDAHNYGVAVSNAGASSSMDTVEIWNAGGESFGTGVWIQDAAGMQVSNVAVFRTKVGVHMASQSSVSVTNLQTDRTGKGMSVDGQGNRVTLASAQFQSDGHGMIVGGSDNAVHVTASRFKSNGGSAVVLGGGNTVTITGSGLMRVWPKAADVPALQITGAKQLKVNVTGCDIHSRDATAILCDGKSVGASATNCTSKSAGSVTLEANFVRRHEGGKGDGEESEPAPLAAPSTCLAGFEVHNDTTCPTPNSYKTVSASNSTQCCSACNADSECNGWTFVAANSVCKLKSGACQKYKKGEVGKITGFRTGPAPPPPPPPPLTPVTPTPASPTPVPPAAGVSVLDYGADPTAARDSTEAFRAALAAAGTAPVDVPAGMYLIGAALNVTGQTLRGLGQPTVKFYPLGSPAQGAAFVNLGGGGAVHGLNVDYQWGGHDVQAVPPCIHITGRSGPRVTGVRIEGAWDGVSSLGTPNAGRYYLADLTVVNPTNYGVAVSVAKDFASMDNVEVRVSAEIRERQPHNTGIIIHGADGMRASNLAVFGASIGVRVTSQVDGGVDHKSWPSMWNITTKDCTTGMAVDGSNNQVTLSSGVFQSSKQSLVVDGTNNTLRVNTAQFVSNEAAAVELRGSNVVTLFDAGLRRVFPGVPNQPALRVSGQNTQTVLVSGCSMTVSDDTAIMCDGVESSGKSQCIGGSVVLKDNLIMKNQVLVV